MLKKYLNQFEVVSVVGMCKNAGKTTVVNSLIKSLFNEFKLGITSIGIDGETTDIVTNTEKPEIYVPKGTLIATAKQTLQESDITYKVVKLFDFTTSLGKIVLIEAMSDGFVKIAGPSFNSQLEVVVDTFKNLGTQKVIVDGAASRKQLAKTTVCDALILATGASYNSKMQNVITDTSIQVEVLNIEYTKNMKAAKMITDFVKLGFIYDDATIKGFDVELGFESMDVVLEKLDPSVKSIVINGAVTDTILTRLIANIKKVKNIEIIVKNPVNIIASPKVIGRFIDTKMKLTTIEKSKLLFVSINPVSAYGYSFDANVFFNEISKEVDATIVNVIGG